MLDKTTPAKFLIHLYLITLEEVGREKLLMNLYLGHEYYANRDNVFNYVLDLDDIIWPTGIFNDTVNEERLETRRYTRCVQGSKEWGKLKIIIIAE